MKREKFVGFLGLSVMLVVGIVIVVIVIGAYFIDMANPLTPYELWAGIGMIVFSIIFMKKILEKKRKHRK